MSLTKDDLSAIKDIVDVATDDSKLQTAMGFAAVDENFAKISNRIAELDTKLSAQIQTIDDKLSVKDNKLENTVQRVDRLEEHVGIV